MTDSSCTHEGCTDRPRARRLCHKHYQAAWKADALDAHSQGPSHRSPRTNCPPDHKHAASTVCYIVHKCGCTDCRAARTRRQRTRRRLQAYGQYDPGMVDAAPVRAHVLHLSAQGIGYKRVAALAGVHQTVLRQLIYGRYEAERRGEQQKRMNRESAARILAVRPDPGALGPNDHVPAVGVHRRVQALVARGWSVASIAGRVGWSTSNFHMMLRRSRVTVATHRAVAELYEQMWDEEPLQRTAREQAVRARVLDYAARRRWLPPLAWDDIDNDPEPPVVDGDDPAALVDEVAIELALAGEGPRLTPAERRECVRRLHAERWSDGRIAEKIRCAPETVLRIRSELGLPAHDLAQLRARGAA